MSQTLTDFTVANQRESDEVQAKDNGYISARYGGTSWNLLEKDEKGKPKLTDSGKTIGVKGEVYFNGADDRWYFRQIIKPATLTTKAIRGEWVRILEDNIIYV